MSEFDKDAPTQEEVDDALNPDYFSGKQYEALKKMDEKNVDRNDLSTLFQRIRDKYRSAKNGE